MSPGGSGPVLGIEDDEGPAGTPQEVRHGEACLSAADDDDVDIGVSRPWHVRRSVRGGALHAHDTRRGAGQHPKPVGTHGFVGLQRNHGELRGVSRGHVFDLRPLIERALLQQG